MRTLYREKIYQCGDYLEVNIYPAYKKSYQRSRKAKPTPEVKKKLNDMYAENKLIRIGNANFTEQDLKVELTYRNECHPEDDESAARELRNFLRRMKNYRKRNSLSELKYIAVTEKGRLKGRYHHHLIISGGISPNALVELWGKGYIHFEPLQFSETGIADLVRYMIKQSSVSSRKKWNASKNLIHPPAKVRDGRLSRRNVAELAKNIDNAIEFEKHFPEYYFSGAQKVMNDINGGIYIYARFYRRESKYARRNQKKRKRGTESVVSVGRVSDKYIP